VHHGRDSANIDLHEFGGSVQRPFSLGGTWDDHEGREMFAAVRWCNPLSRRYNLKVKQWKTVEPWFLDSIGQKGALAEIIAAMLRSNQTPSMAETECVFGDLRLGFGAKPSNHGIKRNRSSWRTFSTRSAPFFGLRVPKTPLRYFLALL
jgi:hypothetical protein